MRSLHVRESRRQNYLHEEIAATKPHVLETSKPSKQPFGWNCSPQVEARTTVCVHGKIMMRCHMSYLNFFKK